MYDIHENNCMASHIRKLCSKIDEFYFFQVPHDFQFSLYELDWIVFSRHMRGAVNLIPVFETAGIKGTVCGPESFTPDHKPLLGQCTVMLSGVLNLLCLRK
jgi:glycine/D-amino acid oxidase-like deaminating enzyme